MANDINKKKIAKIKVPTEDMSSDDPHNNSGNEVTGGGNFSVIVFEDILKWMKTHHKTTINIYGVMGENGNLKIRGRFKP